MNSDAFSHAYLARYLTTNPLCVARYDVSNATRGQSKLPADGFRSTVTEICETAVKCSMLRLVIALAKRINNAYCDCVDLTSSDAVHS